ncbi:unnamed protein product [Albugo candida]|uniref:Uncharacterized protein n=1 Tax=Albugo candida TaxID=65357 RepID=A0A024G4H1_9STRA|nr:unnamed protein product [Albugo candida]|eukprot:CCI41567.1 unnamed protein product [Albugo candida]
MTSQCTLVADNTDDAVQLLLGCIALTTLYIKWCLESPRRSLQVWFFDAMKQGTCAAMIHILNILVAIRTAEATDEAKVADQCAFYFLNFVIDTTVGVYVAYHLLQVVTSLAVRWSWTALKNPGRYGDPPSLRVWWAQLWEWFAVLFLMKSIVAAFIFIFRIPLAWMGSIIFYPFRAHPKVELIIVMIGCPLIMNMIQFWIQDSFLKDQTNGEIIPLVRKDESCCTFVPLGEYPLKEDAMRTSTTTNVMDMYEEL